MVNCGGNDFGTRSNQHPHELVDKYIDKFNDPAKIVVFCLMMKRSSVRHGGAAMFRHFAFHFNSRLRFRLKDAPHLMYWQYHRLDRYLSGIGVHLTDRGAHYFLMSLKLAVDKAMQRLTTLATRHVDARSAALHIDFDNCRVYFFIVLNIVI